MRALRGTINFNHPLHDARARAPTSEAGGEFAVGEGITGICAHRAYDALIRSDSLRLDFGNMENARRCWNLFAPSSRHTRVRVETIEIKICVTYICVIIIIRAAIPIDIRIH